MRTLKELKALNVGFAWTKEEWDALKITPEELELLKKDAYKAGREAGIRLKKFLK